MGCFSDILTSLWRKRDLGKKPASSPNTNEVIVSTSIPCELFRRSLSYVFQRLFIETDSETLTLRVPLPIYGNTYVGGGLEHRTCASGVQSQ